MKSIVAIRTMKAADFHDGMRLKAEAGWNQVVADWRRFHDLGSEGCFVAEREGRVVGTVASCRFGPVGWVAMLLVEKESRGAGIGRSLLMRSLEHLESHAMRSVRLDATAEGRPLYESLGFRVDFRLLRHRGILAHGDATNHPGSRPCEPADLARMVDLDRDVSGTDRRVLIDRLTRDNPRNALVAGRVGEPIEGFVLWRPGSSADQIGPCMAGRNSGRALLDGVSERLAGRSVIVDVPTDHDEGRAWAEDQGLRPVREFWRMTRGEGVAEDRARLWASSGPEMG